MEPAETRCSDGDRETTCVELRRHAADGRLGLPELEARLSRALRARTRGQLQATLDGLPAARYGRRWDERLAALTRAEAAAVVVALLAVVLWATDHLGEDAMRFAIAGAVLVAVWGRLPRRRDAVERLDRRSG